MGRPSKSEDSIITIARMRYSQGIAQSAIANHLGISEATVSRSLKKAFELGILEIQITPTGWRDRRAEEDLCARFGLDDAVVVQPSKRDADSFGLLARATAAYVEDLLVDGSVLGVSDGESVAMVAEAFRRARSTDIDVVSLIGGIGSPHINTHSNEITRVMASRLAARPWQLHAPAMVDTAELATALVNSQTIDVVFRLIDKLSVVVVGIGSMSNRASIFRHGAIENEMIETLKEAGAVGSICGRFFDRNGADVPSAIHARTIAVSLDNLKKAPKRIGVAHGADKVEAICAAFRGNVANVLCTDMETANMILAY